MYILHDKQRNSEKNIINGNDKNDIITTINDLKPS